MTALELARAALAGETAWLVGGAVRDQLLGREIDDVDLAVPGDPKRCAKALARETGAAAFQLSRRLRRLAGRRVRTTRGTSTS